MLSGYIAFGFTFDNRSEVPEQHGDESLYYFVKKHFPSASSNFRNFSLSFWKLLLFYLFLDISLTFEFSPSSSFFVYFQILSSAQLFNHFFASKILVIFVKCIPHKQDQKTHSLDGFMYCFILPRGKFDVCF